MSRRLSTSIRCSRADMADIFSCLGISLDHFAMLVAMPLRYPTKLARARALVGTSLSARSGSSSTKRGIVKRVLRRLTSRAPLITANTAVFTVPTDSRGSGELTRPDSISSRWELIPSFSISW